MTAGLLSVRGGVAAISLMCGIGVAAVIGIALQPGWQRDDWRGISAAIGPPSQTRAILVQPVIGLKPLWAYRDGARAVGDSSPDVKELVVVAPVLSKGDGSSEGTPPRPAHPVAPRSFRLVERRYTDSFSLLRFRARRPQDVSTAEAQKAALSAEHPWTLYRER